MQCTCLICKFAHNGFPYSQKNVIIFMQHGIGPSIFCSCSCADTCCRPWLTITALKKGLQVADDLVNHFFEVDRFMERCLKFKHKLEGAMAQYKNVYKDMKATKDRLH